MFDEIDAQDQVKRVSDQVAFLQKAFAAGLDIAPNESRGVGEIMGLIQSTLPQQNAKTKSQLTSIG